MNQKQRIEELERRVRELEARPVYVYVPQHPMPYTPPAPWWNPYPVTYGGGHSGPETVSVPTVWYSDPDTPLTTIKWTS